MMKSNRFIVENDSQDSLLVYVEPYGHELPLPAGQEIVVHDRYQNHPVVLRYSKYPSGESLLSIWPGDGDVTVTKDGVDALQIVTKREAV